MTPTQPSFPYSGTSHLVATLHKMPIPQAIQILTDVHDYLMDCTIASVPAFPGRSPLWGINMKRHIVPLPSSSRPRYVCKSRERFMEVINMVATIERLIDALTWFQANSLGLEVIVCHPTTSSLPTVKGGTRGNDIVLGSSAGVETILCEVSDIASSKAGQNGKEKTELKNLDCSSHVPPDGKTRYLCVSAEFAAGVTSKSRIWKDKHYRYAPSITALPSSAISSSTSATVLLKVVPPPIASSSTTSSGASGNTSSGIVSANTP